MSKREISSPQVVPSNLEWKTIARLMITKEKNEKKSSIDFPPPYRLWIEWIHPGLSAGPQVKIANK
jgi:hypothetical protein